MFRIFFERLVNKTHESGRNLGSDPANIFGERISLSHPAMGGKLPRFEGHGSQSNDDPRHPDPHHYGCLLAASRQPRPGAFEEAGAGRKGNADRLASGAKGMAFGFRYSVLGLR